MNTDNLISIREYIINNNITNRRGHLISDSYIYRLIRQHKNGKRLSLPFSYVEIGQIIRIKL